MGAIEKARRLRAIIEQAATSLDDETALTAIDLFPRWKPGVELTEGARLCYGNKLYKVKSVHTTQADWPPDTAVSLFEVINESKAGTAADPIPYDGNMELVAGTYYTQDAVLYLCIRDTETAVYHALADLVGLYVEVADHV